jgi:hypothetical protein
MDAVRFGTETLARPPRGPALQVLDPLQVADPLPGGARSRAPRPLAFRAVRLFVLTAVLIALIGAGATAVRTHVAPHRHPTAVLLRTSGPHISRT